MTQGISASGRKMLVKLGDGASPEVFAAPCAMTSRGLNRTKEVNASTSPDCDDLDAVPWTEQEVLSRSWAVSGSGKILKAHVAIWDDFFDLDTAKNLQVDITFSDATVRRYSGAAHLTEFNITGEDGDKVTYDVTLTGDGPLTAATV
ncbi:phage tail tube protein [Xanthobacter autotrophicus DSM 597]|uniref:phage tail tube protein n=1 Tax=Xanthobacter wiegelii TaxID=3119913 RepID=UPI0037296B45